MIDKSIDVKKIAEITGTKVDETSKLDMNQLEMISGGSDYADEIIQAFGTGFAMLYAAGMAVKTGSCPICQAVLSTSGDVNDKEALDLAIAHLQTHVK